MRTRSISNNRKDNKRMGEREEQSEGSQDRRGRNGQAGKEGQRERLATLDSAFPLSCPSGGAVGGPLCTLVLEVLTWPGKGKGGLCAQLGCSERGPCQGRRGLCWSLGGLATAGWPRCLHQGKGVMTCPGTQRVVVVSGVEKQGYEGNCGGRGVAKKVSQGGRNQAKASVPGVWKREGNLRTPATGGF